MKASIELKYLLLEFAFLVEFGLEMKFLGPVNQVGLVLMEPLECLAAEVVVLIAEAAAV